MLRYLIGSFILAMALGAAGGRERPPQSATLKIQAGHAACRVDLDAERAGSTGPTGNLTISDLEPGEHYLHVTCPGRPDATYFISPKANEEVRIGPVPDRLSSATDNSAALAENKSELRHLVQQAVQSRQQGRLGQAVAAFRQAALLDPENSDLHRELGITFLMAREWKRARVEMIEAIRHDQADTDAHNNLGYALEKLGNIAGAVKEYRIATQLEPDDSTYRTHYLDALVKLQSQQDVKK